MFNLNWEIISVIRWFIIQTESLCKTFNKNIATISFIFKQTTKVFEGKSIFFISYVFNWAKKFLSLTLNMDSTSNLIGNSNSIMISSKTFIWTISSVHNKLNKSTRREYNYLKCNLLNSGSLSFSFLSCSIIICTICLKYSSLSEEC